MQKKLYFTLILASTIIAYFALNKQTGIKNMNPPIAKKVPYTSTVHNVEMSDPYHWMRDKGWPKVEDKEILDYLKAENAYTETFFKPLENDIEKVYQEFLGRIKLADKSTPIKGRTHYHYVITESDSNYAIHARKKDLDSPEEIIFDENKEAEGKPYFRVGSIGMSPDGHLMAYSTDVTGDEHYIVHIKNLSTGELLSDEIKDVIGGVVWREDQDGFFYTKLDEHWRSNRLYYHKLGTTQDQDILIYKEEDSTFSIGIDNSSDYKYVIVGISSSTSCEIRCIKSDDPEMKLNMLIERREDHLCDLDHFNDNFYIHTNDKGKNFRLVRAQGDNIDPSKYTELLPHSDDIYLTGFSLYQNRLIIDTKKLGLAEIGIYDYDMTLLDNVKFPDATYSAASVSSSVDDDGVMISYSSPVSPSTTFKYYFKDGTQEVLKVQEIPSGYNKDEYACERVYAPSRDGDVNIPISLVYKKSLFKKDGSNPLLLYGYGSYGIAKAPSFSSNIISLLDRGFVYAIGHIRGGDDLGFKWYESAKFLTKKRTFHDFIDSTKFLIKEKYTKQQNVAIYGGSAGGMLIGNVINDSPELFKCAVAHVPFVDVLNTMLDETLPLTPGEFKEWGNPKEKEYFDYIKSYSPYDNVKAQNYPALYVVAGLNDPRVTYWEPAKWVAKLREMKQDNNVLLLDIDMETGHGGKSGRFNSLKELAKEYIFILRVFDSI